MYDSKSILIDQLEAIKKHSKNVEEGELDLAIFTDGLRAEREQGITIDVAYKYFSTPTRKFIIADAPGHIQYTRNMVTGTSNSDLAIILIDAENGVVEQTRRHSIITSLLGIKHTVIAVNKMDLVDYSEEVYNKIVADYRVLAEQLGVKDAKFIPLSAKLGDNIVDKSTNMTWYTEEPLLAYLESVQVADDINMDTPRFPVQNVIRPQTTELRDYRGYAGKVTSGVYKVGDKVTILPSGVSTTISKIEESQKEVQEAFAPQSIVMHLADDVDVSRGDLIVNSDKLPKVEKDLEAIICWMDDKPLVPGNKYLLQFKSQRVRAIVKDIEYKIDVNTMVNENSPKEAVLNDIVKVKIKTATPIPFDSFKDLSSNGSCILIDETSNSTSAACMIQ
jgi:sulfate adenylyltransferase subunit 1